MSQIQINLATRPFHNNIVYWLTFGGCFAVLVGFTWYNAARFEGTAAEIARWEEMLQQRESEFSSLSNDVTTMTQTVAGMDLKALNERSAFANGIILGRLFSWSQLFDRLEKVQPENVRLRSIRPVITKEGTEVSVDAMTRDYDSLLKFEAALLDSDYFSFVYPLQESSKESQGEIHFNLAFGYVPEGKSKSNHPTVAPAAPAEEASAPDPNAPDPNAPDEIDPNDDVESDGETAP